MLPFERKAVIREAKVIFGRAAGMLYIAGLSDYELCAIVKASTRLAAEEMEMHAQITKDQGGN